MIRGRYEGLLYKLTDESLDSSRRSRRDACLSDRPDRDSDSGPCGGPGRRADCLARDLIGGYQASLRGPRWKFAPLM